MNLGLHARQLFKKFGRRRLYLLLAAYIVSAVLTGWALSQQSESDRRENWNVAATLGSISGPFTGAIARHLQDCCWKFSLSLAPWCGGILLGGILVQFVPFPWPRLENGIRLSLWCVGLLGWFGGAAISLLHALS